MNRSLQFLNFAGILALTVLCCFQWRTNRQLNLRAIDLEKTRLVQSAKIVEQDKTIKGYVADLDDFRKRLELAESALKEVEDKLSVITTERDQLKAALDKWIAAVAQRDEQLQKLATERNDAVAKFNDLANKNNAAVKELNKQ